MIFIGSIEVGSPFFLAPMAGLTDAAFRIVCTGQGAALTYTEMVSAKALTYGDEKSRKLIELERRHTPCGVQIFGGEPEVMEKGAEIALETSGADFIDINMGCPVSKIVGNGEGSALMRDMKRAAEVIRAVGRAANRAQTPLTVKFRRGFDEENVNCVEFAKMAEAEGVSAICIHGRTKTQMYSGQSSRQAVADVKNAVTVPVIASGDIFSAQAACDVLRDTGADFVMIARGAQGNPFIFADCLAIYNGGEVGEKTCGLYLDALCLQARLACEFKGESRAMPEMRKHGLWYLDRLKGMRQMKVKMAAVSAYSQLESLCEEIRSLSPEVKG